LWLAQLLIIFFLSCIKMKPLSGLGIESEPFVL